MSDPLRAAYNDGFAAGAKAERARIIARLRTINDGSTTLSMVAASAARAIADWLEKQQ